MKKLLILFLPIFFFGCSTTPSEKDAVNVANGLIMEKGSQKYIKLLSLKKINGVQSEKSGQQIYDIEYEVEIEVIATCQYSASIWDRFSADPPDKKPFFSSYKPDLAKPGDIFKFEGTFRFEKTDNGWRGEDDRIY